jgi:tight adherence protein C
MDTKTHQGGIMTLSAILVGLSSLCLGYAASIGAAYALEALRRRRQEVRVRALLEKGVSGSPKVGPLTRTLEKISRYLEGGIARALQNHRLENYRVQLETLLRRSGRDSGTKPERIAGMQVATAALAGVVFGSLTGWAGFLIGALVGAAIPFMMLSDEARRREGRILRELPNALEAFSLCVEAGLTLDQAWAHYLSNASPHPWRDELARVVQQVQAGSSRKDALASLNNRLDLTDVALFTSSVVHAEKAGTGVGIVLRRLGATLRDKQAQRAEKSIQELPVKLLLPLLLCIMPVTLLVLFAPILLRLIYG